MTVGTVFPRTVGMVRVEAPVKVKASTSLSRGDIVALDSTGYAVQAGDTSGHLVVGICNKDADNSSGSSGDITAEIVTGVFHLTTASAAITDNGDTIHMASANVVAAATGTNTVKVGKQVGFVSATEIIVAIPSGMAAAGL